MSIRAMNAVWRHYPSGGTKKLVLLMMADMCNDDGMSLHPSNRLVAEKCCVSESQAKRVIKDLEKDGFLAVIGNASGGAPGATKRYRLDIEKIENMPSVVTKRGSTDATGSTHATGSTDARDGAHGCTRRGAWAHETGCMGAPLTTSEPPIEPPEEPAGGKPPPKETRFSKSGIKTLPDEWRDFCQKERPELEPDKVFIGFCAHWEGKTEKRPGWFKSWQAWVYKEYAPRQKKQEKGDWLNDAIGGRTIDVEGVWK